MTCELLSTEALYASDNSCIVFSYCSKEHYTTKAGTTIHAISSCNTIVPSYMFMKYHVIPLCRVACS